MADLFKTFIQHVGHKVPLHPDEFVWRQDTAGKEAMAEARGAMQCLPTLQVADLVWRAIFDELPVKVAAYLQREFFTQGAVTDVQRVFKTIAAPPHHGEKLWLPSFWAGVFETCPGSGGGTNPLEARHSA